MGLILGTQQLAANVTQTPTDHGLRRSPIKVALLSLPPRTHSLLEFFFTNAGRGSFVASGEEQAETAIFDMDTPASRDHWGLYNARTGRPGIALAVKPQEVAGALWVQKPVTPAALLAAAAALRAGTLSTPTPSALDARPASAAAVPAAAAAAALATSPATGVPPQPAAPVAGAEVAPTPARQVTEAAAVAAPTPVQEPPVSAPPLAATPLPEPAITARTDAQPAGLPMDEPPAPAQTSPASPSLIPPLGGPASSAEIPAADPGAEPQRHATPGQKSPSATEPGAGLKSFWQRLFGTPSQGDSQAEGFAARQDAAPAEAPADVSQGDTAATEPGRRDEAAANPVADSALAAEPSTDAAAVAPTVIDTAADATPTVEPGWVGIKPDVDLDRLEPPLAAVEPAQTAAAVPVQASLAGVPAGEAAGAPATAAGARTEPTLTAEQQALFFGSRDDVSAKDLSESAALRYDPEQHLVGALREAFLVGTKWQVPTQIDCGAGFIVVNAERNELHASLDETQLQALASTPLTRRSKVQTLTNLEYVQFKQTLEASGNGHVHRLDDTLWKAALWGSAGRLPKGAQPARTLYLRTWPNLTRIAPIPQAARLAAMWALRGSSVLDSSKQFNLPQRQVIGFYNGVWALNLLTDDGSFARRAQRKGARNRGLLTRLLGWLRR